MGWKENKLGILSVLFVLSPWFFLLLIPFLLFLNRSLPFLSKFPFGILLGLLPLLAFFVFPLVGFIVAILSRLKGETGVYPKLTFFLFAALLLFFLLIWPFCPGPPPPPTPVSSAAGALESAYQTPSQLVTSRKVTFTKSSNLLFTESNNVLSKSTIVDKANIKINPRGVCLSLGDFSKLTDHGGFEGGAGSSSPDKIVYKGTGSRDAKLSVLCYTGNELESLVGSSKDAIYPQIDKDWVSSCECVKDPSLSKKTCCLIALRAVR